MLDQHFLRNEYRAIAEKLVPRGYQFDIPYYEDLESRRKSVQSETEACRHQKNELSKQIGSYKATGKDTAELMSQVIQVGEQLDGLERQFSAIQDEFQEFVSGMPNVAHESVPVGVSEDDNLEVRRVGTQPQFDFEPKDHVSLGENLGMLDFELASKLAGSRFVMMRQEIAAMHRAISQLMIDTHNARARL